jgi:uncharacterized protein YcsI (UPF0317 family)
MNRNVPMYKTNWPTKKSGIFEGPLVVSMRPMSRADALKAKDITAQYPRVHGDPVRDVRGLIWFMFRGLFLFIV